MDELDRKIRDYLEANRPSRHRPGLETGPTTEDYHSFLMGELEGEPLEKLLTYLRDHPEDRAFVARARELLKNEKDAAEENVPSKLLEKVKRLYGLNCPHCGKPITPFKRPIAWQKRRNAVWLGAAAASFAASFLVPRYFLQMLALALLFGVKWIVDRKAVKTQILIYKALREDETLSSRGASVIKAPADES